MTADKAIKQQEEPEEEQEMKDPLDTLRDKCKEKCTNYGERLNQCNDRVNGRSKTAETCVEEVIDFFHCVDHCAAKNLFNHLK